MSFTPDQLSELSKALGGAKVELPPQQAAPAVSTPAPAATAPAPAQVAPAPAPTVNEWDPTRADYLAPKTPAAPAAPAAPRPADNAEFIYMPTAAELAQGNTPEAASKQAETDIQMEIYSKGLHGALADAWFEKNSAKAAEIERVGTLMEQKADADRKAGIKTPSRESWDAPGVVEQGITIGSNLVKGAGGLASNLVGGAGDIFKEVGDMTGIREMTAEDKIQRNKRAAEGGRAIDSALEGTTALIKMPSRGIADLTMNASDIPEWQQNVELAKDKARDMVTSRQIAEGQRGFVGENATAANKADAAANPDRKDILADQEAINQQALAAGFILPAKMGGGLSKATGKMVTGAKEAIATSKAAPVLEKAAQALSDAKAVVTMQPRVPAAVAKATREATQGAAPAVKRMMKDADKIDAAAAKIEQKVDKLSKFETTESLAPMTKKANELREVASKTREVAKATDPDISKIRGSIGRRLATTGLQGDRYATGLASYAARRGAFLAGRAALGGLMGHSATDGHGGGVLGGIILGGLAGKAAAPIVRSVERGLRSTGRAILSAPKSLPGKVAAGAVDVTSNAIGKGIRGAGPGALVAAGISAGDWERMTTEEKNQVLAFGALAGAAGNQLNPKAPRRAMTVPEPPRPGFQSQPDLPALAPRDGARTGPMPEGPTARGIAPGESGFEPNPAASPLGTPGGLPALDPRQGPRTGPMPEAPRGGLPDGESGFESNPAMSPLGPDGIPAMTPRQGPRTGPTPDAPRGSSVAEGETGFESTPRPTSTETATADPAPPTPPNPNDYLASTRYGAEQRYASASARYKAAQEAVRASGGKPTQGQLAELESASKASKAWGMELSAAKRLESGNLTPKEIATRDTYHRTNYRGKPVMVEVGGKQVEGTVVSRYRGGTKVEVGGKVIAIQDNAAGRITEVPGYDYTQEPWKLAGKEVYSRPEVAEYSPEPYVEPVKAAEPVDVPTGEATPTGQIPSSGVRTGTLVPEQKISELTLSKDVPQFKRGADPKTGVVRGQELQGKPDKVGMAPIIVWERTNGRKEVISGRHRLDLFRRAGEETIPTTIVREADGFTARDAITLDAELNIRDGQGSVNDYADYHRAKGYTEAEAIERGLLRGSDLQGSKARQGFEISKAGDDLYAAFQAGRIPARKAAVIAKSAAGDARLERAGMAADKSLSPDAVSIHMENLKKIQPDAGDTIQGDFFADDTLIQSYEKLAKVAGDKVADINKRLNLLRNVGSVHKMTPAQRKEVGVSVKDPNAITNRITELEAEANRYRNYADDEALFADLAKEAGVDLKTIKKAKPAEKPQETQKKDPVGEEQAPDLFGAAEPTPAFKNTLRRADSADGTNVIEGVDSAGNVVGEAGLIRIMSDIDKYGVDRVAQTLDADPKELRAIYDQANAQAAEGMGGFYDPGSVVSKEAATPKTPKVKTPAQEAALKLRTNKLGTTDEIVNLIERSKKLWAENGVENPTAAQIENVAMAERARDAEASLETSRKQLYGRKARVERAAEARGLEEQALNDLVTKSEGSEGTPTHDAAQKVMTQLNMKAEESASRATAAKKALIKGGNAEPTADQISKFAIDSFNKGNKIVSEMKLEDEMIRRKRAADEAEATVPDKKERVRDSRNELVPAKPEGPVMSPKKPKAKKDVQPDRNLIPEKEMPFNLVGEEDTTPLIQKQVDAEKAAALEKAASDKAQGDLFAPRTPAAKKPTAKKPKEAAPKEPEKPKLPETNLTQSIAKALLEADKTPKGKLENMFDKDGAAVKLRNQAYKALGGTKSQPTGTDLATLLKEKFGSMEEARTALNTLASTGT